MGCEWAGRLGHPDTDKLVVYQYAIKNMQLNIHEVLFTGEKNCLCQLRVGNLWLSSSTAEKSKSEPWTE